MKEKLTQNPIVAVVAIVALAAGTLLVAGYAEKPGAETEVAAEAKCAGCPLQGTPLCCKVSGESCCGSKECASACQEKGCQSGAAKQGCESQTSGCTREKAAATATTSPCTGQTATPFGTGGCTLAK